MVAKVDNTLPGAFQQLRSDYAAAKESQFRRKRVGIAHMGSGADYHYREESRYYKVMEYARDMDRNDAAIGSMIDRAVTNTLQCGFALDTSTGDKKLDSDLWDRWHSWASDPDQCDLAGELCFNEMESIVYRQSLVDGDHIVLPVRDGPLALIEAHRVRTPRSTKKNVIHGVLLDDRRKRLEYWVTKDDISPLQSVAKVSDVTPYFVRDSSGQRQVFHVYNPKRVSQTRGMTALAPVFDLCGMFEDINFAKVVQQQIVSCIAFFREMEAGAVRSGTDQKGSRREELQSDGTTRVLENLRPGVQLYGEPGEKLSGFSPAVPNPEFFDHVKLILTLIGINLGLPLILVLMDASETNFSGWRGAFDQAKLGFRRNQKMLMTRFHDPVYRFKVRQWMAEDPALRAAAKRQGIDIFGHKWNAPTWPYIEPEKDARAQVYRVRTMLTSPRRMHAEENRVHEEIVAETVADNAFAIRAAKAEAMKINSEFKDDQPVHWRDVLNHAPPEGVTASTDPLPPEPVVPPLGKKKEKARVA